MDKKLKNKIIRNVAIALAAVIGINLLVLAYLGFPLMAKQQLQKYWPLIVLLIIGLGLQVSLYTYHHHRRGICSATTAAGGLVSTFSMVLCCSHYLVGLIPFISLSAASFLTEYTPYILLFGIIFNLAGILVMIREIKKRKQKGF